jgi:Tol biopolymer transport system component
LSLSPGQRIGPFEIIAPLGAGAMGEVWRAKDPRIGREVAVKVLPEAFARDPERLLRFEVEARAAGALNHPNILTVFEAGVSDGAPYVASELLEGGTLRSLIAKGPLAPKRAIELALQAARGLAAAHERGVLHRDLKPENLFVTRDNRLKILDFGLAKLTQRDGASAESGDSLTATMTQTGVLLGTVGYMAPEQARGQAADARSDLFALGTVLHEMLSGARTFQGASAIETLAAVIQNDAPPLPESVPPALRRVVEHLLEKEPAQRFQSARDLAFALESLAEPSVQTLPAGGAEALKRAGGVAGTKPGAAGSLVPMALALLAGAALTFGALRFVFPAAPPDPPHVSEIGSSDYDADPDFSPDGKLLAFTSRRDGRYRVYLRQLASGAERAFGPDTAFTARFTPDGLDVILAVQKGQPIPSLHRTAILGDADRVLASKGTLGAISPDGKWLVFSTVVDGNDQRQCIMVRDMASGAERTLRTVPASNAFSISWSPDSRRFATIVNADLQIGAGVSLIVFTPQGEVVDSVVAAGRGIIASGAWTGDPNTLAIAVVERRLSVLVGESYLVTHRIGAKGMQPILRWPNPILNISVGGDGEAAFGAIINRSRLSRVPLGGGAAVPLTATNAADRQPSFSHDGTQLLFASNRSGPNSIWRITLATGELQRMTQCEQEDWDPAYTPDDQHILFSSSRGGNYEIWMANADGTAPRQVTHDGLDAENPTMTKDGRWIVYASGGGSRAGIWKIHPDGTGDTPLVRGRGIIAEVSPDGRYASFIDDQNKLRVVRVEDGALMPFVMSGLVTAPAPYTPGRSRWRPDGNGLYVLAQERSGRLALYEQPFTETTAAVTPGTPLLTSPPDSEIETLAVSPDGKTLVISYASSVSHLYLAKGLPGIRGRIGASK